MKVTVNKNLNARIGAASTFAACESYKTPSSIIEIDDVVVGTEIDGNAIWYKNKEDGNYYWSGGVEDIEFEIINLFLENYTSENQYKILETLTNINEFYFSKKIKLYSGCAIGDKNSDPHLGYSLIIYVSKKESNSSFQVPPFLFFRGIKIQTDVQEVNIINQHDYKDYEKTIPIYLDNDSPLKMGGSICNPKKNYYGTRGVKLTKNNKYYLTSCFHVLLNDYIDTGYFTSSDNSNKEGGEFPSKQRRFGTDKSSQIPIVEGKHSKFSSIYDYAVCELKNPLDVRNKIADKEISGFYGKADIADLKNKKIETVGATSFRQEGSVLDVFATIYLNDGKLKFSNVITTTKISMPGDSGAPVIDEGGRLIGFIIGGNEIDRSFIIPFYPLVYFQNYFLTS